MVKFTTGTWIVEMDGNSISAYSKTGTVSYNGVVRFSQNGKVLGTSWDFPERVPKYVKSAILGRFK